jgi:hypothetical protein
MAGQAITADVCAKMVESATRSCHPLLQVPPAPVISNADGLAALSTAFVYGSILLAILVVIAGFAWAKFVAHEAKEMAKADAETYIVKWMVEKAPGIIQSHVELLNDATIGEGNDASAADELGKEAG